jgi:hypothetical protein
MATTHTYTTAGIAACVVALVALAAPLAMGRGDDDRPAPASLPTAATASAPQLPESALHPDAGRRAADRASVTTDDGYTWTLHRGTPSGPVESVHDDLVVTGHGTTQKVAVPAGWAPRMFHRQVRVGDLTDGVLLSQEGGDSDTWRVYVRWDGRAQQLRTHGPVALGGGFTRSGSTAYLTWMSADRRLYTRIGTQRPGRFHVYTWTPAGATASTAPVLEAKDLGVVCLDDTGQTFTTCPS